MFSLTKRHRHPLKYISVNDTRKTAVRCGLLRLRFSWSRAEQEKLREAAPPPPRPPRGRPPPAPCGAQARVGSGRGVRGVRGWGRRRLRGQHSAAFPPLGICGVPAATGTRGSAQSAAPRPGPGCPRGRACRYHPAVELSAAGAEPRQQLSENPDHLRAPGRGRPPGSPGLPPGRPARPSPQPRPPAPTSQALPAGSDPTRFFFSF